MSSCTRDGGWNCDAKREDGGCLSGNKVAGKARWRCLAGCDFDYCGVCYAAKQAKAEAKALDAEKPAEGCDASAVVVLPNGERLAVPLTWTVAAAKEKIQGFTGGSIEWMEVVPRLDIL